MLALLAGGFTVALAYGIVLPITPILLERRLAAGADVSWHTGLLTGIYTFALFLFAPAWGRLSDRWERKGVILVGLVGSAVASVIFAFIGSLPALYVGRFLSGAFSAAVVPVALALLADWAADEQTRARHFTWLNVAGIAGSIAGPAIGGTLGAMWIRGMPASGMPFLLIALAAGATAVLALATLPPTNPAGRSTVPEARRRGTPVTALLLLSLLTAWALGTFEVGLTLRAAAELKLGPEQTGFMFVECMVVMVIAQLLLFNPWFPSRHTRLLFAPAFLLLAVSMLLLWRADDSRALTVAVGGVAAAAGVLSPLIAYWVSLAAGRLQGAQLGWQTSAASLGQTLGSTVAGLMIARAWSGGAFLAAGVLALAGALLAVPLARGLGHRGAPAVT
jgi:MFS family permease